VPEVDVLLDPLGSENKALDLAEQLWNIAIQLRDLQTTMDRNGHSPEDPCPANTISGFFPDPDGDEQEVFMPNEMGQPEKQTIRVKSYESRREQLEAAREIMLRRHSEGQKDRAREYIRDVIRPREEKKAKAANG
jgi:hypothetical protein